jgi:prepilin peptidase CpaA
MQFVAALLFLIFPALVIAGGIWDLTTLKIPNKITGALALAFFPVAVVAYFAGAPLNDLLGCLGVGVVGLAIGLAMFALNWIGGGDAKLIAAAGLWLGVPGTPDFLICTTISGGFFALGLLSAREWGMAYAGMAPPWVGRLLETKGPIPYGIAIAIGSLAASVKSPLWQALSGGF